MNDPASIRRHLVAASALFTSVLVLASAARASAQSIEDRRAWSRAIEAQEREMFESMLGPVLRGEFTVYRGHAAVRDNTIATPGHVTDLDGPVVAVLHLAGHGALLAIARTDGAHVRIEQEPTHPARTHVSAPVDAPDRPSGWAFCEDCVPSLATHPARIDVVMDARGWDQGRTLDGNVVIGARLELERVDVATLDARALAGIVPALRVVSPVWRELGPSLRLDRDVLVREVRGALRLAPTAREDGASCHATVDYDIAWHVTPRASPPLSLSRPALRTHVTSCCRSLPRPGHHVASSCTPPPRICDDVEVPLDE